MTITSRLFATIALLACVSLYAQEDFLRVTVQPANTEWGWKEYSETMAGKLAKAIEKRVKEGLPRREFAIDTAASVVTFSFRVDSEGRLRYFKPVSPRYRYLAYLIERTALETSFTSPLPPDFQFFYYDGTMTFYCRMHPTGFYKRFYFEQPLDTLPEVPFNPVLRKTRTEQPLALYEPDVKDKNLLLEEFKKRIGIAPEITDTSGYSPLVVAGREFAVRVAFDSLTGDPQESELLQKQIERALEEAGATVTEDILFPTESEAVSSAGNVDSAMAKPDSTLGDSLARDSLSEAATAGSAAKGDSLAQVRVPGEATRPVPPDRDISEAFEKIFSPGYLVLSAGLARDSTGDTAVCRIRLYPAGKPNQPKRLVNYRFVHAGILPDSLGRMLVTRLTAPPPRPEPPKAPPKAAAAGPKAAAGDTSVGAKAMSQAAPASGVKGDSTAAPGAGTQAADTSGSSAKTAVPPADSTGSQPIQAVPADSAAVSPPPDSGAGGAAQPQNASPGTSETPAAPAPASAPAPDSTPAPATPAPTPDSTSAPADSTKSPGAGGK